MTTALTLAAIQMACSWDLTANLDQAEAAVVQAAQQGAQLILLPELFETPYFCKEQNSSYFELAKPATDHPTLTRFSRLAAQLKVVLPLSFFEQSQQVYYNSVMIIDADGKQLGIYRKTHIPDGPGYQEKFYFSPGDTGFKVWNTCYAKIGVGICWDQWFPESARIMALQGAELLCYPTAIGSEPTEPDLDSASHWQRVMQGHAAANLMPLVAANRVGTENADPHTLTFYGSSFIADATGSLVTQADRQTEMTIQATFNLAELRAQRINWGVFRDRRPSQYRPLLSLEGHVPD